MSEISNEQIDRMLAILEAEKALRDELENLQRAYGAQWYFDRMQVFAAIQRVSAAMEKVTVAYIGK